MLTWTQHGDLKPSGPHKNRPPSHDGSGRLSVVITLTMGITVLRDHWEDWGESRAAICLEVWCVRLQYGSVCVCVQIEGCWGLGTQRRGLSDWLD